MCCLFYTQNPLWWTGLAAAMPVWQSILQGKSVLFVFGSLVPFSIVGWKSAFDACLWSYHGNTRGRAGLCQGAATRSMVTVRNLLKK